MTILTDDSSMPFGKHKGKPMKDVPARYLHWYFTECDRQNPDVYQYIVDNLVVLEKENEDLIWR